MNFTFNRFDTIEHTPLRVFNRTVFMNNIVEDFGADKVKEYLSMFEDFERRQMFVMQTFIQKFGVQKAREFAVSNLTTEEKE